MTDDKTIEKLEALLQKKMDYFDQEEVDVLKRVINIVRGFDTLGSLAGFVSKTVAWFGAIIGGFIAVKAGILDLLHQGMDWLSAVLITKV